MERTLSIIKPDGVKQNLIGKIYVKLENAGFKIIAAKMQKITKATAAKFYEQHSNLPFFNSLIEFMSSGAIMVQVLEKTNAILDYREIMGATDPAKSEKGTIRADFATSIESNIVHGSDSVESSLNEIKFFFSTQELLF